MTTLKRFLCGVALGLMATPALAQDFYVSGFGGVSIRAEQDLTSDQNPAMLAPPSAPASIDPNSWAGESFSYTDKPIFGGAVGASFGLSSLIGIRAELEGSRRKSEFRAAPGSVQLGNEFNGEFSAISGAANIFIEPQTNLPFQPYVGGGVGVARIKSNIRSTRADNGLGACLFAFPSTLLVDALSFESRDTAFIWQLIGGVEAPIAAKISAFADARYYKVQSDIRHNGEFGVNTNAICPLPPGQVQFNAPVEGEYDEISVVAGIRLRF